METQKTSLWQRVRQLPSAVKSALEGSYRPAFGQSELGNWFRLDALDGTGFQRNLDHSQGNASRFGPVYTSVAILSQEISRIEIKHIRIASNGQQNVVRNKAPYRVFRKPNRYQTKSDFMLYLMRSLLLDGNAYAIAVRNDRNEVSALYPVSPREIWPYVVEGEVFYHFGDQNVTDLAQLEQSTWYPQRDVLHVRLFCPAHPLIGESPLTAAMVPAITGMQINAHTETFFKNMSRPSGILRYPKKLGATPDLQESAIIRIKQRFMAVTQGSHTGEPLVLQEGADFKPLMMSAVDSELIKSYNLSERQVLQCYRIPPFLAGDLEKASFQNVESLSRYFLSSCLGFYVDHLEEAFLSFFDLPTDEYIRFDVDSALLRGDLESRMNAMAKGIQSGVLSPNEARSRESLAPVEHGDEPRVQQQLVPLSYGMQIQPPGVDPAPEPEPEPEPTEEQRMAAEIVAKRAIQKAMGR